MRQSTKAEIASVLILSTLKSTAEMGQQELIAAMKHVDIGSNNTRNALKSLVKGGEINIVRKGHGGQAIYSLTTTGAY